MGKINENYSKFNSLNLKKINELSALGRDLQEDVLGQMLELHFSTAEDMVKNMHQFFSEDKYDLLKREVHKFKSNCGNLGLEKLFNICRDFEKYLELENNESCEIEKFLSYFQSEYELTCVHLKEIKKGA